MTTRRNRRTLITVIKTLALTAVGIGAMALPLGIAMAGKAMGL